MSKSKSPTNPAADAGATSPASTVVPCQKSSVKTNLGDEVDKELAKCPQFSQNMQKLIEEGWSIEYGQKGKGSYCSKSGKKIVIDENKKGNTAAILGTLAHESGHAMYTPDPYVGPEGLTKEEYAGKNANSSLKDEGEATLTNIEMKECLEKNGGMKINVAGAQAAEYEKIAKKYLDSKDRDKARQEIGDIFADKERPSTDPKKTYREYYEQSFKNFYDKLPDDKKTIKK